MLIPVESPIPALTLRVEQLERALERKENVCSELADRLAAADRLAEVRLQQLQDLLATPPPV